MKILAEKKSILTILENLDETTVVRITNTSKRKAAINRAVLDIAKEENDPLYFKYKKARERSIKLRAVLRQKYMSKARLRVVTMDTNK